MIRLERPAHRPHTGYGIVAFPMTEVRTLTATATDGTNVRALDQGQGPVILILHPGMETGTRYQQVAAMLARRFRVIRLHRRQYRLDLKRDPKLGDPCTVAQEVEHVLAIVRMMNEPVVVYGHSSGGPVALESLLASAPSFVGAVIYEPASVIGSPGALRLAFEVLPGNGEVGEGLQRCRSALAMRDPGKALGIFISVAAGWPAWATHITGKLVALQPAYRELIPCQIDDLEAMERLGVRLEAYSRIGVPTVLLGGDRSPKPLQETVVAVARAIPSAGHVVLHGRGHDAHVRAPEHLARVIEAQADTMLLD
jgi:pimeloyl-ACP methyl ester carboxylesterase